MPGGKGKIRPSDNPKPWVKGQVTNIKGPIKKIYTIIREMGYGAADLKAAFGELSWYSMEDLKAVHQDQSKPIIVRIVANQLFLALAKGDMSKIREILEYTLGKPSQSVDLTTLGEKIGPQEIHLSDKEIKNFGDQLENEF